MLIHDLKWTHLEDIMKAETNASGQNTGNERKRYSKMPKY